VVGILVDRIISTGMKKLGSPYVYNAPAYHPRFYDCSSFIQYIYGVNGVFLPRNARQQYKMGTLILNQRLKKGDLLFFTTGARKNRKGIAKIGHVATYIGSNKMIHTYRPMNKVVITEIDSEWKKRFIAAKRVL